MKSLCLCVAVFAAQASALLGFGSNACKSVEETYFKTDNNACAVLFDEDDCGGWAKTIAKGEYLELPSRDGPFTDKPKKRDAEALVVRKGCTLVARTEPAGFRGHSFAFAAEKSENLIIDDLDDDHEDLEEEIEAVHCYCGGAKTPKVTESQSVGSAFLGALGGKNFRKCNDFIGLFDRPNDSGMKMTCAILFDEENCDDEDGFQEVPVGFTKLDGQGLLGTGSSMDDDAESVMVRPGCTFTGYDKKDKSGRKIVINNSGKKEPKVKNLDGDGELEEEISSVECKC